MIGKILREKRIERGMTQVELARKAIMSNEHLNRIECEKVIPNFATVEMICNALDVEITLVDRGETDGKNRS